MQSNYHNLPIINGFSQKEGGEYLAQNVHVNVDQKKFSLDLSKSYLPEAGIDHWHRAYQFTDENTLEITDDFKLQDPEVQNEIVFMTWVEPELVQPGIVQLTKNGISLQLAYNKNELQANKKVVELTDSRLSSVWGTTIYQFILKAKNLQAKGNYQYTISKLE